MDIAALPRALYSAADVRELDRLAIQEHGIPGITLMKQAGRALFQKMLNRWPALKTVTVYCGTGNNGGDGFVVAALACERGIPVQVVQVGDASRISGDALLARQMAEQAGVSFVEHGEDYLNEQDGVSCVIVDALLGTGLAGEVRENYREAIERINNSGLPVIAADIPSGLCSDTGKMLGSAVRADCTMTFIGVKQGLLTASGPACVGDVYYADLEVPESVLKQVKPRAELLDLSPLPKLLPRRPRDAHKGSFGHVMIVGGDYGMAGAAAMAAQAASRCGAGLVSVATRPQHINSIVARCPEVMAHGVVSGQEVEPLLARATVLVVGPGLGQNAWGEQLLQKAVATGLPMVLDADALNILAGGRVVKDLSLSRCLLTPHPGEAGRLLGSDTASVQADRFTAVKALQERFGGTVILKGAGSLVCHAESGTQAVGLCAYGNPGMATGGMGDVLSGLLGGLLAQGLSPGQAAALGACLHAHAGDLAAQEEGERGLQATDLIPRLRLLVNSGQVRQ
jgi:NAD(P)H-hydrate epimerase